VDRITEEFSEKIGFDTTAHSKSFAIDTLSPDLEDGMCVPHSAETYEELRRFVHRERRSMGGLPGKQHDRVMALSLAKLAAGQSGIGEILS